MRGKAAIKTINSVSGGITPAYAGKSDCDAALCLCLGDHPRLCGEKHWAMSQFDGERGSPPPMRGKEQTSFGVSIKIRITPAYAGKRYHRGELYAL